MITSKLKATIAHVTIIAFGVVSLAGAPPPMNECAKPVIGKTMKRHCAATSSRTPSLFSSALIAASLGKEGFVGWQNLALEFSLHVARPETHTPHWKGPDARAAAQLERSQLVLSFRSVHLGLFPEAHPEDQLLEQSGTLQSAKTLHCWSEGLYLRLGTEKDQRRVV